MRIVKPSRIENPRWALTDVYCPKCFPGENCGFADGGLVHDGDLVAFHHQECGHIWEVLVSIAKPSES
jgi:hypothetical protein